jgi:hypothetical protein
MVREPDATMQPTPQDIQLMSKRRVLSFKPQLRLEWRGQDGQNETEQSDHSASLGDSITSSTRIRFSVHTGVVSAIPAGNNSAACHGDIQTATWSDIEDSNPFYHHGFRQRCTRRRTRLDRRR